MTKHKNQEETFSLHFDSMTSKPNQEFKVRLSRTSSAQAVLKKERKKSIFKVDDMIDDDRSTDTVTGKLPTEAAYVIMKRVTAEVGLPLNPAGISTYNKLQSLKTSPAVELLQQKTWREFFSKKTASHVSMAKNPKSENVDNDFALLNGTIMSSTEDLHKRQSEMKLHLVQMFDRLVSRVEQLWTALKIPDADRTFYRKSLCKGPPQSIEQCREIAVYVAALKVHQDATVSVIQAIQMREMAIAKCFDVLAALQRKFSRTNQRELSLGGGAAGSSLRSSFSAQLNFQNTYNIGNRQESEGLGSSFWKEELIIALDDVRACSLEVIKRVQTWRRNLWRPHPFVYMGVNYVAKMKDDLSILESDIYTKLLALVPLKYSDLQCIVFFSNAGKIFVDAHPQANHSTNNQQTASDSNGNSPLRPPPHPSSAFDPSFLQSGGRNLSASGNINHNHNIRAGSSSGAEIYILQLLQEFLHKVHPKELHLAATIVLEEEMLQNALAIEHASLLSKGVFIPTLHSKGGAGQAGAEKVVARSTLQTSSTHSQGAELGDAAEEEMQQKTAPFANNSQFQSVDQAEMQQQPQHNQPQNQRGNEDEGVDWAPDFA